MSQITETHRGGTVRAAYATVGAGLALVLVAACLLRLWHLGGQSLWSDELFSVFWSQRGLGYVLGPGRWIETNPPLYYALLSLWIRAFGDFEIAVRLLSVLLSLATLPVVYRVGRLLCGREAGLFAAALFAFSGLHVYYAQEARAYSLFTLTAAVTLLGCVRVLRASSVPEPGIRPLLGAAIPFVLGAILALYAHATGIVLVAAADLVLLVSLAAVPRRRELLAVLVLSTMLIAIAAVPQAQVLLTQSHSANLSWIPRASFMWIAATIQALMTGYPLVSIVKDGVTPSAGVVLAFAAVFVLAVLTALTLARCLMRCRRDWPVMASCLVLPLIGLMLLVAISEARPILLDRTAIWLTLPLYWAMGAGLATFTPGRRQALLFAALIVLEAGFALARLETDQKEPWRSLIADAAKAAEPGDVFILTAEDEARTPGTAFAYYWKAGRLPELRRWDACPGGCPLTSEAALDAAVVPAAPITLAEIDALLARGLHVWVVSRTPLGSRDSDEIAPLYSNLGLAARETARFQWQDKIVVSRWQR